MDKWTKFWKLVAIVFYLVIFALIAFDVFNPNKYRMIAAILAWWLALDHYYNYRDEKRKCK